VKTRWGLAAALLAAAAGQAQTVSLKQLLDSAEQQNVDRRITHEQRLKAAADFRSAWTSLLPSFTGQASWTHNQYAAEFKQYDTSNSPFLIGTPACIDGLRSDPPNPAGCGGTLNNGQIIKTQVAEMPPAYTIPIQLGDQFDGLLRFDLPLIDTTRWTRTMAASSADDAAALREQLTSDLVKRQVVGAYFGYAAALSVRESAKKSVAVAEAQLNLMEIRFKAGAVTELEQLRARAEVQRNRQVVADTENLVATTRRSLRTVTGLDPGDVVPMPTDDLTPEKGFEELEQNIEGLPAVKAADKDAEGANRLGWSSRLLLLPSISANFMERFSNATGFTGKTANWSVGVAAVWRLDVPTFMGLEGARATEATAVLAAERARLQARDQVHSDWQRLKAAMIKVEAAAAQSTAASRAAQVARDRYAVGAATQVDVIQAERDLFGAEVSQIQARTELASARASLHLSAGLPLGIE